LTASAPTHSLTIDTKKGLRALNLRQNLLTDASALGGAPCAAALEDLELRDNQVAEVCVLSCCA
jgi:hypothetical protein